MSAAHRSEAQFQGCTNFKVDYHRNGICGWPFFVVTFDYAELYGNTTRRMVATVPTVSDDSRISRADCIVCVLDVDLLHQGVIGFGRNSWRGDDFAEAISAAIDAHIGQDALDPVGDENDDKIYW